MPPKAGGKKGKGAASKKKKKPSFDPFERVCEHTVIGEESSSSNPAPVATQGVTSPSRSSGATPQSKGPAANAEEGEVRLVAEFLSSGITIIPPLPRTEAALHIQFQTSIGLSEGDVVYIYLPKFTGPPARQFALESVLQHTEGPNPAVCFQAYWSGTTPKVMTPVQQLTFKRGAKAGVPPKQVLMLRCSRAIPLDTLIIFGVPRALGLITPDKLPANSTKLKIEGVKVSEAEGGRILKQVFMASNEIKKRPVAEELAIYEECLEQIMHTARLTPTDREISEELSAEEVDQLCDAAIFRRPYPIPMAWTIAKNIFVEYEAAGAFIKTIIKNAVQTVKSPDPLAVHKEVARNWGVKTAAVVLLDDSIAMQCAGLYPGIARCTLLAAFLLTMEPDDIGRTFLHVRELPKYSIAMELSSAFRTRSGLGTNDATGELSRCETILNKWGALLSSLLNSSCVVDTITTSRPMAAVLKAAKEKVRESAAEVPSSMAAVAATSGAADVLSPTTESAEAAQDNQQAGVRFSLPPQQGEVTAASRRASLAAQGISDIPSQQEWRRSSTTPYPGEGAAALRSPPTLYIGYRDVPLDMQNKLREMLPGEWWFLPSFTLARQTLPYFAGGSRSIHAEEEYTDYTDDAAEEALAEAAAQVPDNAVVVEVRGVVEGLELADVCCSPYNRPWLLPLGASCRIVSIETDAQDVLHIVLEMVGSLVGQVADDFIPESDRSVALLVSNKLLQKVEQHDAHVSAIALMTYITARRNWRRRLHPPTLMRAQYLTHYNEAMRISAAKQSVEEGSGADIFVEWQVRTHEAQMLDEGVVKPAQWEPIPKKYMASVEELLLGHCHTKKRIEEGTLIVDLDTYTIDYASKGPRPLRRMVQKMYITHERLPSDATHAILRQKMEQNLRVMTTLDGKLGINSNPTGTTSTAGNATAGASRASSQKKSTKPK